MKRKAETWPDLAAGKPADDEASENLVARQLAEMDQT